MRVGKTVAIARLGRFAAEFANHHAGSDGRRYISSRFHCCCQESIVVACRKYSQARAAIVPRSISLEKLTEGGSVNFLGRHRGEGFHLHSGVHGVDLALYLGLLGRRGVVRGAG